MGSRMAVVYECAEADHLARLTVSGEMTDETVTELWIKGLSVTASFSSSLRVFVAPSDFIYGSIRRFQILSEKTRQNLHVVRTMQDAYKLLGIESPKFAPLTL